MERLSTIKFLLHLLVYAMLFAGCQKDDLPGSEDSQEEQAPVRETLAGIQAGERLGSVRGALGCVHLNAELGLWYIAVTAPGTYDSVVFYYVANMEESFRREGLDVVFSGEYYAALNAPVAPAGYEIYVVELSEIVEKLSS